LIGCSGIVSQFKQRAALGATAWRIGIIVASAVAVGQRHPTSAEVDVQGFAAAVAVQNSVTINTNTVFARKVISTVVAVYVFDYSHFTFSPPLKFSF